MMVRAQFARHAWTVALLVIGPSVLAACTWKVGGPKDSTIDAGAGGSVPDASVERGAGGRSQGSGGTGSAGKATGNGGAASGGASSGGSANGGERGAGGSGNGGSGNGGSGNRGSGGSETGGALGSGGDSSGGATGAAGAIGAPNVGLDASASSCAACPTGVCAPSGECAFCLSDTNCAAGHVCSTGQCLPACGNDAECAGNFSCCGTRCADLARDYRSCGACGVSCSATQFCGPAGCETGVVSGICDSPKATFPLDGLSVDDPMSALVKGALVAGCPATPGLTAVLVDQTMADTIHPVTGRPVAGSGDLQVVLGGWSGQHLIRYLENQGITRIYFTYDGTGSQFRGRSGDGGVDPVVVDEHRDAITGRHDFFIIETVVDPATGTLTLAIFGFSAKGTIAAAWYFNNEVLPNRSSYTDGYYIYEWTAAPSDAGDDPPPGAGDSFRLVASGS